MLLFLLEPLSACASANVLGQTANDTEKVIYLAPEEIIYIFAETHSSEQSEPVRNELEGMGI